MRFSDFAELDEVNEAAAEAVAALEAELPMEPPAPGAVLSFPVPDASADNVAAYLADPGAVKPAPLRKAATVMLLRDGRWGGFLGAAGASPEVFVIKRAATMAFVPGAVVFPGGGLDARDVEEGVPWQGEVPNEWIELLGCSEGEVRAVAAAAAREVFEETGVLLACHPDGSAPELLGNEQLEADRARVEGREISFGAYLRSRELVLRGELLSLRSHWVTPAHEPRRYDTYFFAARVPEGQRADGRSSEASASGWFTPQALLRFAADGGVSLMPPTVSNLVSLTQAATVDEALALPFSGHVQLEAVLDAEGDAMLRGEVR